MDKGRWKIGMLIGMAIFMVACSTIGKAPLDDAYYWEGKSSETNTTSETSVTSTPSPSGPTGPSIEVLNAQDTTVTIRIKR